MLIERARRGQTVVRLKGGDPFIFGRGGEEMEALAAAGIPFEIVPGVTTPLGIAAYTGVPLTHREHSSAVTFVTGHNVEAIDWSKVGAAETIVLFMGLVNFPAIARELIETGPLAGYARDGGALGHASGSADHRRDARRPAGAASITRHEAARDDRRSAKWWRCAIDSTGMSSLPLFGQRIVVTRDRTQAADLAEPLEALGAEALLLPVIEIREAQDPQPLQASDRSAEFLRLADLYQRQWRAIFHRCSR